MTSFITEATRQVILSDSYRGLTATLAVVAIVLLLALLIQKEVLRASGKSSLAVWMRTLNVAIMPLLLTFGLVFAMRLVTLLVRGLR